jgi:hypothetical protein
MSRLDAWLASALEDADRRGLAELRPLLEGLARSIAVVRDADHELSRLEDPAPELPAPDDRSE